MVEPGSNQPPFVGRQREMERLAAALDEAITGHGWMVMLPGIGKTRTAQELTSHIRQEDAWL